MKNIVGIGHIAIRVKDIDRTLDYYRDRLGSLTREKQMGADGILQAWIEDSDGNRIELMQGTRTTCRMPR